jgi:glycosyltransferase involved in cell wall biosynthesis
MESTPMQLPWVTVIITAYNHDQYVVEAIDSVVNQSYAHIQIILIDNGSQDQTYQKILPYLDTLENLIFIKNVENRGLCKAFNQGLSLAKGKYIVDLSADDVLLEYRIEKQVGFFEQLPSYYGVIFSNAIYWDTNGNYLQHHFKVDSQQKAIAAVASGAVFKDILERYFICTPTMMIRADLLRKLEGYDETLAFEDFDFWVRSSVLCHYQYQDEILTVKRELAHSFGKQIIEKYNPLLASTLKVCQKAYLLCELPDERVALAGRIQTFIRKSFYCEQFQMAFHFAVLHRQIQPIGIKTRLILFFCKMRLPLNNFYRAFRWLAR